MKNIHITSDQSGRSILETLAVLVIIVVLTIGGLKGYSMLRNSVVSGDLEEAIVENVVQRRHDLMKNAKHGTDRIAHTAAHNTPLSIQNGAANSQLDGVFWIDIGTQNAKLTSGVCEKLLASKKIMPYRIEVDNKQGVQCDENGSVLRFYFKSSATSSEDPDIECDTDACGHRICPSGSKRTADGNFECIPGYRLVENPNPCLNQCQACTGNTYSSSSNSTTCTECPEGQKVNESHTGCIPCKRNEDTCCPNNKKSNGSGECVECLDNGDCPVAQQCKEDGTCDCEPDGTQESCLVNDTGHPGTDKVFAENCQCVACLDNYSHTHHPGDCPADKPICSKDHSECLPCNPPYEWTEDGECKCPTHNCDNGKYECGPGSYVNNAKCDPCPAGTYSSSLDDATECDPCPAGTYSTEGSTSCQPCSAGTYADGTGNTSCTDCDKGTYQDSQGQSHCKKCSKSYYQPNSGQSQCLLCDTPQNVYSDEEGLDECKICDGEFEIVSENHDECITCPLGQKANSTHTECINCSETERCNCLCPTPYSDGEGHCHMPENMTTDSCPDCPPNYCFKDGKCVKKTVGTTCDGTCESGYYKKSGVCTKCEKGYYCPNQNTHTKCPAGTFNNNEGQTASTACNKCNAGTYSKAGSATCTDCPAGQYQNNEGQTACIKCGKGTFSSKGATSCSQCDFGSYQPKVGQSSCSSCTGNKTTTGKGSTAASACVCKAGFYLKESKCTACPNGSSKSAVSNATSCTCASGYTWSSSSKKCYRTASENYTCDNKHGSHISHDWLKKRYNCYQYGTTSVNKCGENKNKHTHYWCMAHDTCTRSVTKWYPN